MTDTLIYPPERDGYSFNPGDGYIATKLKGGSTRLRKDILEPSHIIQANWVLRETEYTEFMGFFHSTLQEATLPFLVDLLGDLSILTKHKARCIAGRPRLTANRGNAYFVTATLEVENNATYTGTLNFSINTGGGQPARISATPHILSQYQVTDQFRIHRAIPVLSNPTFNFDGVYTVTAKPNSTTLEDTNGNLVNSAWGVIDPGNVNIAGTITRVPA